MNANVERDDIMNHDVALLTLSALKPSRELTLLMKYSNSTVFLLIAEDGLYKNSHTY